MLSVADADDAVSYGPGLRWGVMGPSLQWHLGGGSGGIKHFMEHLMDPLAGMIKVLGATQKSLMNSSKRSSTECCRRPANRSVDQLAKRRTSYCSGFLRLRAQRGLAKSG